MSEVELPESAKNPTRPLTERQENFCREYMRDLNVQGAYVRAGFSGKDAKSNAYRVYKLPQVQARIEELKAQRLADNRVTIERVRDSLLQLAIDAGEQGQVHAAARCWELLGKYLGMFNQVPVGVVVARSAEELDREITRLRTLVDDEKK